MIFARMDKLKSFLFEGDYAAIRPFLESVNKDMQDGEYPISGEDIFARVQTYATVSSEEGIIEAHNKYIDIQFSILGAEGIGVFDRTTMQEIKAYDTKKDVVLFKADESRLIAETNNTPGYFTLLYPEDAHRPKERINGIAQVKKAVIKLRVRE